MAGPGPPALMDPDRDQLQRGGQKDSGGRLHTRSAASAAMACAKRRRRRAGLAPIFATAVTFALGADAVSVPEAPSRVDLDVLSGNEVAVAFSAPLNDGGSAVQSYEVCATTAGPSLSCLYEHRAARSGQRIVLRWNCLPNMISSEGL